MLKERILLAVTLVFSILCSFWFIKLALDTRQRAALLEDSAVNRAENARENTNGDIIIGVAYNSNGDTPKQMKTALEIAAKEINSSKMLNGRKVILSFHDDKGNVDLARSIAQGFADDININIVIGHPSSTEAMKVQPIYEFYGILFFSPSASNPRLSSNGARYFFRNYPNDREVGKFLATFCKEKGWKELALMYPDTFYGKGIANSLETSGDLADVDIVARTSYQPESPRFKGFVAEWKKYYDFDAMIGMSGYGKNCELFIKALCSENINVPLVLTPNIDSVDLSRVFNCYHNDIYVLDIIPQSVSKGSTAGNFVAEFKEKSGILPNYLGFNSYDALYIIAQAIAKAGNDAAPDVAEQIHEIGKFKGAGGNCTFTKNGDCERKINITKYKREPK